MKNNFLINNADKCHLLVSSNDVGNLRVSEYDIKNSECEKFQSVKFDNKLPFEKYIIMNAFINSQFNYCPLIWMCHNRTTNRKINRLYEKCLRIIRNEKQSSFKMLLEKDRSASIHDRNIQCLATEMYKVSNGLSPSVVSKSAIFLHKKTVTLTIYDLILSFPDLLLGLHFTRPKVYPILIGLSETFDSYKNLPNFSVFKKRIIKWKTENCPCRLCKTYISRVSFTYAFAAVSLVFKFLTFKIIIKFYFWQLCLNMCYTEFFLLLS